MAGASENDATHDPAQAAMVRIDALLSHIWMVRTFLKHADEAADDEELQAVYRELYDFALALGPAWSAGNAAEYLKQARKKLRKLTAATTRFAELQPEVSTHTNFQMAVRSLETAVADIGAILRKSETGGQQSDVSDE